MKVRRSLLTYPPFGIGLAAGSTVVADAGERLIFAVTADVGQAIGRGPMISAFGRPAAGRHRHARGAGRPDLDRAPRPGTCARITLVWPDAPMTSLAGRREGGPALAELMGGSTVVWVELIVGQTVKQAQSTDLVYAAHALISSPPSV
jgi:hypothetical protein